MTGEADPGGRGFWAAVVVGGLVMAWGVRLYLVATPDLDRRVDFVAWLVGLDLAHDLVLAPVIVAIGYLVSRLVPAPARAAVQVALILSGTVLLVGLLPLTGSAGNGNPTIQPIRYGPPITAVILTIWLTAGAATLLARPRRRSRGRRRG